jgi:preprotein translocase subunit SecF
MSRYFIDRPVFAWVVALVIMLAGILAILSLPIAQYPTIAPPAVSITATYPGASAEVLETSVTQVIEQQLKGIDHLLYFSSNSALNGQTVITVTFEPGTNPDIAQVQVQNKLTQATPLLPTEVQQQGLIVAKAQADFIMVIGLYDTDGRHDSIDLGDYMGSKLVDPISRLNGVGDTQEFGSLAAIRIWLDPYKLNNYKLMPSDVSAAVLAQNVQVPAGEVGALPSVKGQELDATVNAQSRLKTPEQFRQIILRTATNGSVVRLSDVARVELAGDSYAFSSLYNGHPAAGLAVKLASGANALNTVALVKKKVTELSAQFPPGIAATFPVDNSSFIKLSIKDVIITLVTAVILVVAVMFLFLQNWRATLIPAIAVPVVLLGSFAVLAVAGYSINVLTLFAMVLAIGLLVDDAIVVVENVQRIMEEEGLSPKEATIKSMGEITGALVGIATVLSAVFLPMAFFGGSTGAIYRQFSVTIVSAMVLSVTVALVLTPALCATLLKPIEKKAGEESGERQTFRGPLGRFFHWFNKTFDRNVERYEGALRWILASPIWGALAYVAIFAVMAVMFVSMPSGFLPDEDQGEVINLFNLPPHRGGRTFHPGALSQGRGAQCGRHIRRHGIQLRRRRPEHRHGVRAPDRLEGAGRRQEPRAGDREPRHGGLPPNPRRPGLRARAPGGARSGQRLRLRHGARRPGRARPPETDRRRASAPGDGGAGSAADGGAAQWTARYAAIRSGYRSGAGRRARPVARGYQRDPERRDGRRLYQRLLGPRPGQTRLHAGRRRLSDEPRGSGSLVRALFQRLYDPLLRLLHLALGDRSLAPGALQRPVLGGNPGSVGARQEFRRGDDRNGKAGRQAAQGHRL